MKPKFILWLALVLSGGLLSFYSSAKGTTALFPITEINPGSALTNMASAFTNDAAFENWIISYGFIDQSGAIAIPPNTNWLQNMHLEDRHFVEGLEPVQMRWTPGMTNGFKWGYLDEKGKFAVEPQFSDARPFSEGLAAVRGAYTSKYGYIDHAGKFVISPQFDEVSAFSGGIAWVSVSNLVGYIDKRGAFIIKPKYRSVDNDLAEGLFWVEADGKWGCVNEKGETVIGFKFEEPSSFSEGLAAVTLANNPEYPPNEMGYIDKTGAFVIAPQFSVAWKFSGGLARVEMGGKMLYINKQGKTVFTIANGFWADEFSEGLANVSIRKDSQNEVWGYINRKGDFVIKPQFQLAKPFYNGLAQVFLNGQEGYIDKSGKFVWKGKTNPMWQPETK